MEIMTSIGELLRGIITAFTPDFIFRKRRWDEDLIVEETIPEKRRKQEFTDSLGTGSNILSRYLKDSNTQTEESSFKMLKKGRNLQASEYISLVDEDNVDLTQSRSTHFPNKENILFKGKVYPGAKRSLKPPRHCSRLQDTPVSKASDKDDVVIIGASKTEDNDVQYLGPLSSKKSLSCDVNISQQPLWRRAGPPVRSSLRNLTSTTCFKKYAPPVKIKTPTWCRDFKDSCEVVEDLPHFGRPSMASTNNYVDKIKKMFELMSTKGYREIVQQAINKPQMFRGITDINSCITSKSNRHQLNYVIDLTADIVKKKKPDTTVDLTNEEVIEIVDLESSVKPVRPPVSPVNSMEKKLRETRIASENVIDDLEKEMTKLRDKYDEDCLKLRTELYIKNAMTSRWQKALEDRVKRHLKITQSIIDLDKEEEEEEETVLPDIPDKLLKKVSYAWGSGSPHEVLISKFNYKIKRIDMKTLYGLNWLNDEILNFYMELIMQRSKESTNLPKVYCCNTFFYMKLSRDGYASVKRWTKKIDIFSFDVIFIPVHLAVHWCMAEVNFLKKEINYFDSMGNSNERCLKELINYLKDEMKDKKNDVFDDSGWKKTCVDNVPQQNNSSDCGVFACSFAEYLSRRAKITFSQEDMPYMRKKMAAEILRGELLL